MSIDTHTVKVQVRRRGWWPFRYYEARWVCDCWETGPWFPVGCDGTTGEFTLTAKLEHTKEGELT